MADERTEPTLRDLVIPEGSTMGDIQRQVIFWVLEQTNGNRTEAAWRLGISVRTIRNKLSQYREIESS